MVHVAILGAYGSAGAVAARTLADRQSVELTLIDDGDPGGGLCILRGCMPSKEVISAGAHRFQARHDHRLAGDPPEVDLAEVVATKDDHVADFAAHRVLAAARRAVGDRTVDPDYVIVATGSTVNLPDLPGMAAVDPLTSVGVLNATTAPDSGVVMGFGYIGLELVPYLAEAGTDLTVIEHDDRPLDEADRPFGDEILDLYREEWGVDVRTNARETAVESTDEGVRLHVEGPDGEDAIEAEQLYCFTGRRPAVEQLGLENTSLSPGPGWVADTMQSTDHDRVFVAGDANGIEPILHVAKEQGAVAAENVLAHARGDGLVENDPVHHHVVFSGLGVYPFARVGLSEAEAEERGWDYVSVTRQASDDGVFRTKDVPAGLARLLVDSHDGTVLGYQGLHYHADVMAKTMQLAVEMELDVREIPDTAYHPTTPEVLDGLIRECAAAVDQH
jgi:pyruvate/2-oxoglutarate dehydrogenase complex dihydrolipoamide dehydrogenase (E3) component